MTAGKEYNLHHNFVCLRSPAFTRICKMRKKNKLDICPNDDSRVKCGGALDLLPEDPRVVDCALQFFYLDDYDSVKFFNSTPVETIQLPYGVVFGQDFEDEEDSIHRQ